MNADSQRPDILKKTDIPYVDRAILDEMRELLRSKFPEILRVYLDDTARRLAAVEATIHLLNDRESATGDLPLQAHAIRSSSHYFGALRLADLAGVLEHNAVMAQKAVLEKLAAEMKDVFEATQDVFHQMLENVASVRRF